MSDLKFVERAIPVDEAFNKRVNRKRSRCGDYIIECKKGHWTARSPSQPKAEKEARRYYASKYTEDVRVEEE